MSLGISTGPALNSLAYSQQQLTQASNQASSGKRLTNASIDPSGRQNSGTTPATTADAQVTNNDLAASGGNVLSGATASGATINGTITV